jgi:hypothetical protein
MEWNGWADGRSFEKQQNRNQDKSEGPEAEVGKEVFYADTVLESALAFSYLVASLLLVAVPVQPQLQPR